MSVNVIQRDARFLSPDAQEELRIRVVLAVEGGLRQCVAAQVFGVSPKSVSLWRKAYRAGGLAALRSVPRGRRPGQGRVLSPEQERTLAAVLGRLSPDQVGLAHALWTRQAVAELIEDWYGISLTVQGVGLYLHRWGFTPQKPQRRAVEQDPKAVTRWVEQTYPELAHRAEREGAVLWWLDETGARADHTAGRSYALRGHTPVIAGTGKRFGANVITVMSNTGSLGFEVFTGTLTAVRFCDLLDQLTGGEPDRSVYLIVDSHPAHTAGQVTDWLAAHPRIHLVFLPTYAPELNPVELLNQDLKTNAVGRHRPRTLTQLIDNLTSWLTQRQHQPQVIRHYFTEPHVRYAA